MTEAKRHDVIVTTSVVVTIVAAGIVVAGLLTPRSDPTESDSTVPVEEILSEPVTYPVDIPGCEVVEPPPDSGSTSRISSVFVGETEPDYDNPSYPWLTAEKASAMSDAVRAALPPDVVVRLAPPSRSFTFQPVDDYGDDNALDDVEPTTSASGEVVRAGSSAYTTVTVGPSDAGVPDCVAGRLDARTTEPSGTVVDTSDTWYELSGERAYFRSATGYHPDGTRTHVGLSGTDPAELPLETMDLATIAASPGLALSTPAPPGTPAPRQDCSVNTANPIGTVQDVRQESVDAANTALTTTWASIPGAPALSGPIGSLVPDGYSSGVCTDLDVVGTRIGLSVSVIGGQPLPTPVDPYDPNTAYGPLPETRILPDGSVVQTENAGIVDGLVSEDGTTRLARSVTVTRPTGVQIAVRSTADVDPSLQTAPMSLPEPLSVAVLEALAQSPIAVWP